MYIGDYDPGDSIHFKFTTRQSTGAPFTLAGTPGLSVYKDNSATQTQTGVTITADFDSITGYNHVTVDTSADGTFYSDGSQFDVIISTGTVNSVSVVGEVIGRFTLRAQACLYPTTAGRKLDVSAGGEAGIDWANIGSPTTVQDLSGTVVSASQTVLSVANAVIVGTINANVITSAAINADAFTAAKFAADVSAEIADAVWDEDATAHQTLGTFGQAIGDPAATTATIYDNVAAIKAKTDLLPADPASNSTVVAAVGLVAGAVWDITLSGHNIAGSTGEALGAAGGAGDPWITAIPGAYATGSAGYILGTNLDTTVSTRATQTSVDTIDDFLDTEIAAIKAKTDLLPTDPASNSVTAAGFTNVNGTLSTIAGYIDTEVAAILAAVDTEVAAIKAKTDLLPSDPASNSATAAEFVTVNSKLDTIDDFLDTEVAAIKAKTDQLTFTASRVDASVVSQIAIKKNTQLANFQFMMTDTTNHNPLTGLTVTVQRSIDGGAFANATNTPATEIASGAYKITLSAADLNGDTIMLKFTATGADTRFLTIPTQA